MYKWPERLIGRKQILEFFKAMYGISSWWGVKLFCRKRHVPLRKTPSGKPLIITDEVLRYDQGLLDALLDAKS